MTIAKKRNGLGLQMKTIKGESGIYLFMKTPGGSYHVFLEVEAKQAAKDCGASVKRSADDNRNTRQMCKEIWDKN